jgi:cytochrome c oxidase subunit 3
MRPPSTSEPDRPSAADSGKTPPAELARFGMALFLAALGVLFLASIAGYLVVRLRAPSWPPVGSPRLPGGLWISTLLLLLSSFTMHRALGRARAGRSRALVRWLAGTALLGTAFLLSQVLNWVHLLRVENLPAQRNLYAFTFYMLTGLHGLHVVGGLVPMALAVRRAGQGRYTPDHHGGVVLLSMYWHFLDAVWLVLFAVLMIAA